MSNSDQITHISTYTGPSEAGPGTAASALLEKSKALSGLQNDFATFYKSIQEDFEEAGEWLMQGFDDGDDLVPEGKPIDQHIDMLRDRLKSLFGATSGSHGSGNELRDKLLADSIIVQTELEALRRRTRKQTRASSIMSAGTINHLGDSSVRSKTGSNEETEEKDELSDSQRTAIMAILEHLEKASTKAANLGAELWAWSVDGELVGDRLEMAEWWNTKISSLNPFPDYKVCGCVKYRDPYCDHHGGRRFTQSEIKEENQRLAELAMTANNLEKRLMQAAPWISREAGTVNEDDESEGQSQLEGDGVEKSTTVTSPPTNSWSDQLSYLWKYTSLGW